MMLRMNVDNYWALKARPEGSRPSRMKSKGENV